MLTSMLVRFIFVIAVSLTYQGYGANQLLFSAPPDSERPTPKTTKVLTSKVKDRIRGIMKEENIPGLTVGVVRINSGDLEMEGFGISTEDGDPVTPDSLFFIGSCSKAFLVTSLGLLMDDYQHGRNTTPLPPSVTNFDWSTKVKDLLPGTWKLLDPWASKEASLGDILTHLTGLHNHNLAYSPGESSPRTVVENLRYLIPKYEFRETWQYNNLMFTTAGHIMNTYSEGGYANFVARRIFKPLGMNSTTFSLSKAESTGRLSHTWEFGRRIPHAISADKEDILAAAGGIMSNAHDMTRWLQVLMKGGIHPVSNETVIPPHIIAEMTKPRSIASIDFPSAVKEADLTPLLYGMGWMLDAYRGHKRNWHTGGLPGFLTWTGYYPDDDFGIFMSYNTAASDEALTDISFMLADSALGFESSAWSQPRTHTPDTERLLPEYTNSLDSYAHQYYNKAYGYLNLCDLNSEEPRMLCSHLIETFASVNITRGLAADWVKIWTKHVVVTPLTPRSSEEICSNKIPLKLHEAITVNMLQPHSRLDADTKAALCLQPAFIRTLTIHSEGYGKDKSPFIMPRDSLYAVFLKRRDDILGLVFLDGVDEDIFDGTHSMTEISKKVSVVFTKL